MAPLHAAEQIGTAAGGLRVPRPGALRHGSGGEPDAGEIDLGRRRVGVREIADRWSGAGYRHFNVVGDDGDRDVLRHDERRDAWDIAIFERAGRAPGDGSGARGTA
jgi:hypothetical protein